MKCTGPNKGKKFSDEWKRNLSISHKGQICSKETREKLSIALKKARPSTKINKNCIQCSKIYFTFPSRIKNRFCSKECYSKNQIGRQKAWNKGLSVGILYPSMGFQKGHPKFILKHSKEAKEKMSIAQKNFHEQNPDCRLGEKNPRWILDRTKLKTERLQAYDCKYKDWMLSVKNMDGWKCKIANGDCSGRLEAHHILSWRDYPELRYQLNNGITLCHQHHPRRRAEEEKLSPYFQELVKGN